MPRRLGCVYRHGEHWWLQVRYQTHTYRKPATATSKRGAHQELDAWVTQIMGGLVTPDSSTWTVAQLLTNLETALTNKGIKGLYFYQAHGRALRACAW